MSTTQKIFVVVVRYDDTDHVVAITVNRADADNVAAHHAEWQTVAVREMTAVVQIEAEMVCVGFHLPKAVIA